MQNDIKLPIEISENDIDYNFAMRAYCWNSFTPDKRAKEAQKEYVYTIRTMYQDHYSDDLAPKQKDVLDSMIIRFRDGYKKRFIDVLGKRSRTASSMITGPAKFPVEKNRIKMEIEHRASTDLYSYVEYFSNKIRKELNNALEPEVVEQSRKDKLITEFNLLVEMKKEPGHYSANLFKSNFVGKMERSSVKVVIEVLRQMKEYQESTGIIVFTPRHKIWKFGEKLEKVVHQYEDIEYDNGISIKSNEADNRIQILFPDKPNEDIRKELKSHGWRWSGKNGAWQRKTTINAYLSAQSICNNINQELDLAS
jgi:hypothetical protein